MANASSTFVKIGSHSYQSDASALLLMRRPIEQVDQQILGERWGIWRRGE